MIKIQPILVVTSKFWGSFFSFPRDLQPVYVCSVVVAMANVEMTSQNKDNPEMADQGRKPHRLVYGEWKSLNFFLERDNNSKLLWLNYKPDFYIILKHRLFFNT